ISQYVKIPRSPSLLSIQDEVTIEFWMKADPNNLMNTFQGLVTSDFYHVEISEGFQSRLGVNMVISTDGGQTYAETADANGGGAIVTPGVWHHIAGTYDGTKVQLYIDGKAWGQPRYHTGKISQMLPASFMAIGSEDGRTTCSYCLQDRYFNGAIDEVGLYK